MSSILDQMWDGNGHRVGPFTVPERAEVTRHDELAIRMSVRLERLASFAGRFSVGLPVRSLEVQVDDIIAYGVERWPTVRDSAYTIETYGGSNYILADGRKVRAQRTITPHFPREADPRKLKSKVSDAHQNYPEFNVTGIRRVGSYDKTAFDLNIFGAKLVLQADEDSGFVIPGFPAISDRINSSEGLVIVNPTLKIDALNHRADRDTSSATFSEVIATFPH